LETRACPRTGKELTTSEAPEGSEGESRLVADRYRLRKRIGKGPTGVLYEAEHVRSGRTVGLKLVRNADGAKASSSVLARVRNDMRTLSSVAHPNICVFDDVGELPDGVVYFAMDRLRGTPLKIDRGGLRESATRDLVAQLLSALHSAHSASVVHGNVKPTNVFLETRPGCDPSVKVLDFGGYMPRSARYVSPEEMAGETPDARSDLWSVGVVLYRMLTGHRPYAEKTVADLLAAIRQSGVVPPTTLRRDLSRGWDTVIRRALERAPNRRFSSALEFIDALPSAQSFDSQRVILPSLVSVPPPSGEMDAIPDSARALAMRAIGMRPANSVPTDPALWRNGSDGPDGMINRVIAGKYRIDALIGKGSAGGVYRGLHLDLGREVAMKILHAHNRGDAEFIRRFKTEARVVSKLDHMNITRVLDFGQEGDGLLYLVMEYVAGASLESLIASEGRLPILRVVKIGIQVCSALIAAHEVDIIHRDIKPENLLLVVADGEDGPSDLVKVCDFGTAKLSLPVSEEHEATGFQVLCGSPAYMSPEQARCETLDQRSDIYSLGVTLYEALTGELPIKASGLAEQLVQAQSQLPRNPSELVPDVDPLLVDILMRMLEKDPDRRHATLNEVRAELKELATQLQPASLPDVQTVTLSKYPSP
jgi:serine/threonine protein kinase